MADVLRAWTRDAKGPKKLAVPLAHRYTKDGIAWATLKGIDVARAAVLVAAARQARCQVHLALLTFREQGSAGYEDEPPYWGRGAEDEPYTMEEVFEWSLSAEHWQSPEGHRPRFGTLEFAKEEIVPPDSLTNVDPEEDFEGYTGNAGMTLERWYRHAAVVLWPDAWHADVVPATSRRKRGRAAPARARSKRDGPDLTRILSRLRSDRRQSP